MIGVSLACFLWASSHYNVPTSLLLSIAQVEGGRVGTVSANTNGTQDLGPMQINTIWLDDIAKRTGQTPLQVRHRLINDGCYNVGIGAWILKKNITSSGDPWLGAAYYHSRTPALAKRYLTKVYAKHQRIAPQLQALSQQRTAPAGSTVQRQPIRQQVAQRPQPTRPVVGNLKTALGAPITKTIRPIQSARPVQQGNGLRTVRYIQPLAQPAGSMSAMVRAPDHLALGQ